MVVIWIIQEDMSLDFHKSRVNRDEWHGSKILIDWIKLPMATYCFSKYYSYFTWKQSHDRPFYNTSVICGETHTASGLRFLNSWWWPNMETLSALLCAMQREFTGDQGPIPETICSRLAQIHSCDPDRPIAFHKRWSRSAHQIKKIQNQTVYCQLNHDINHSLGNLELKLRDCDWMKNVRLMISIHDVAIGGVATSFMSADTRASWPVQCMHTVFAHDTIRFGHAIFDRYVYVINVIENIKPVDIRQTMFQ